MAKRKIDKQEYALYYPEEGRYSIPMTLKEAFELVKQFPWASVVSLRTAEIYA